MLKSRLYNVVSCNHVNIDKIKMQASSVETMQNVIYDLQDMIKSNEREHDFISEDYNYYFN